MLLETTQIHSLHIPFSFYFRMVAYFASHGVVPRALEEFFPWSVTELVLLSFRE